MTEIPDGIELTPFDDTFYENPYAVYERLRRLDPLHEDKVSFYGRSWTISDYDTVKNLLTDRRLSADARSIGLRRDPRADNPVTLREPNMMNLDGDAHHRLRALVHKAFTPSSVDKFRSQIEHIVDACLDKVTDREFDAVQAISKPVPTMVIADYIGVDSGDHEKFKSWTDSLLKQGYPVPTEEQWQEIVDADISFRNYLHTVIQSRRTSMRDDLVSRLIQAEDDDKRLGEEEIIDMCFLLIGAGNFTTTDLISNTIFHVLSHNAQGDASTLVEETLRFDPPSLAVRRFVTGDIEVSGKTIKKGSVVTLLTAAANHDPAVFAAPDNFEPAQGAASHLAFGRGIHHCLGAPLARLEATITLQKFRARFPNASIELAERDRRMDFRGFRKLVVKT